MLIKNVFSNMVIFLEKSDMLNPPVEIGVFQHKFISDRSKIVFFKFKESGFSF
jgi:hypothetical protein